MKSLLLIVLTAISATACAQPVELAPYLPLWTRDKNAGTATLDQSVQRTGQPTLHVEHSGQQDWSLSTPTRIPAKEGEIYELSADIKLSADSPGSVTVAATAYNAKGQAMNWSLGARNANRGTDFQSVRTRFVIPADTAIITPRVIGHGKASAWMTPLQMKRLGSIESFRKPGLKEAIPLPAGKNLTSTFDTRHGTFTVTDQRNARTWRQQPANSDIIVCNAFPTQDVPVSRGLAIELYHVPNDIHLLAIAFLEQEATELSIVFRGPLDADLSHEIHWPGPFVVPPDAQRNPYLVVPENEGLSYAVDDPSISPKRLVAYGGHGICMAFFGCADQAAPGTAYSAILGTPDDVMIQIERARTNHTSTLAIHPVWQSQKGRFGYQRQIRYCFFDKGGHVAIAKRYREYAKNAGLLKTLTEKKADIPATDRLIGAVNIWCWDRDPLAIVKKLNDAGIDRILWSNRAKPEVIKIMNEQGILTSRYDVYQDVMDPTQFPRLRYIHTDWTTPAWPDDLMRDSTGDWIKGWRVESKDGAMIPCGVTCDKEAVKYARERIPTDLKAHPYLARFIDTTTASPWRECYDPRHPLTRTQSREWKMNLLEIVSRENKLVTGCETGHDASVPYLHFFEGMMSVANGRVADSGRRMQQIVDEVPPQVLKFQVNPAARLPLWELVYHDCTVSYWYWGDYNNKLPAVWKKRDLFNALYAVPGMFMFDKAFLEKNQQRFKESYATWSKITRQCGYSEMTNHEFLTPDRQVQRTTFANGVTVTANFSEKPFTLPGGEIIQPESVLIN